MSKDKSQKRSNAEDFLAQVEWQNRQSQGLPDMPLSPWYMTPKWKHKRGSSFKNVSPKKISTPVKVLLVVVALGIGYFLYKNDIIILLAFSVMGLFVFFIVRDATRKPKDGRRD